MATKMNFRCPNFAPYNQETFKGTWVVFTAKQIKIVTAFVEDTGGIKIEDEEIETWRFLLPPQIQENVVHDWQPWETMASRMAGLGKEYRQIYNDATALGNAIMSGIRNQSVGGAFKQLKSSSTKINAKVDTPLVYEDSQRMQYQMTFNLVASDFGYEIVEMVRRLEELSAPDRSKEFIEGTGLVLPCIFQVKTEAPDDISEINDGAKPLLDFKACAITAVQPTYMQPYDGYGYPMRCELTIEFKDVEPLYRDKFQFYKE